MEPWWAESGSTERKNSHESRHDHQKRKIYTADRDHPLADEPRELLYILFWFAGETLCDYLFLTGYELRCERRLAGRLASIKIVFSESYEMPNYTQSEVDELYSEIEKDVNKTLHTVSSSTWKYP